MRGSTGKPVFAGSRNSEQLSVKEKPRYTLTMTMPNVQRAMFRPKNPTEDMIRIVISFPSGPMNGSGLFILSTKFARFFASMSPSMTQE